jgi:hypothetical protein
MTHCQLCLDSARRCVGLIQHQGRLYPHQQQDLALIKHNVEQAAVGMDSYFRKEWVFPVPFSNNDECLICIMTSSCTRQPTQKCIFVFFTLLCRFEMKRLGKPCYQAFEFLPIPLFNHVQRYIPPALVNACCHFRLSVSHHSSQPLSVTMAASSLISMNSSTPSYS